jgi:hypothetical protein
MAIDRSDFEAHCESLLRDEVHAKWEQSGRDFGRAEPPPPTLRIERVGNGVFHVNLDEVDGMAWRFPWDGSDPQLHDWIETLADDYWGDYCDPGYKFWQPPRNSGAP